MAALVDEVLVAAALNQIHFSPLQMTQVLLLTCTNCTGMHILILHISQTKVILSHLFKKPVFQI